MGIAPSGEILNVPQEGHTPAFDFTFGPPKSVSVHAYLRPDQAARRETIAAHEAVVAAAVANIEAEVMASRRGKEGRDGTVKVEIAAAQYRHGTIRENDPQVHTHVVLVALPLGEDGRWRTLDSHKFFGVGRVDRVPTRLGQVYGAALITVLAGNCYRFLTRSLPRYELTTPDRIWRHCLDNSGTVDVFDDDVRVDLALRTYTPVLIDAGYPELDIPIPWWGGRRLEFGFPAR